jgi:hypothetical protein
VSFAHDFLSETFAFLCVLRAFVVFSVNSITPSVFEAERSVPEAFAKDARRMPEGCPKDERRIIEESL